MPSAGQEPPPLSDKELLYTRVIELLDGPKKQELLNDPKKQSSLTYRNILYALSGERKGKEGDKDAQRLLKTLQDIESNTRSSRVPLLKPLTRNGWQEINKTLAHVSPVLDKWIAGEQDQYQQCLASISSELGILHEKHAASAGKDLLLKVESGAHRAHRHLEAIEAHQRFKAALPEIIELIERVIPPDVAAGMQRGGESTPAREMTPDQPWAEKV